MLARKSQGLKGREGQSSVRFADSSFGKGAFMCLRGFPYACEEVIGVEGV